VQEAIVGVQEVINILFYTLFF